MTFNLSAKDFDRLSFTPLYRQLAELITAAIDNGELQPGDPLPSEVEMIRTLKISRPVIREGIAELVRDGLIIKRHGAATHVAPKITVRSLDTSRYQAELDLLDQGNGHPDTSAFVAEQGADWSAYSIDTDYQREKANRAEAEHLAIAEGELVIRREFLKRIDGKPQQIQHSTIPLSIARKTILEDPNIQPYPGGTIAELYAAGHRVTRVVEQAWARMPTNDERSKLQQLQLGPVWDIVRIFWNSERPVEMSRVITPTAANVLRFATDLH